MRRSILAALVAALLISGTALAAKPPTAALSLAGSAQYGVPLTFNVSAYTSRETILYSLWVVVRCQAADGGSYLEVGPGQNWVIDGRRSAHTTVGPFTMASGVPPLIPGSAGITSGDWDGGGPAECEAWVWLFRGFGLDTLEEWRVSDILTFSASG